MAAHLIAASGGWLLPLSGYTFLSLAEGHHRMVERLPQSSPLVVTLLAIAFAAAIGSWLWALSYGGVLHAAARLLGGKPGLRGSIHAVGLALVWPGLLATTSAVSLPFSSGSVAYIFLAFNLAGGFWAVYTVIAAIRVRHEFTWWRAVSTWAFALTILLLVGLGLAVLLYRVTPS